MSRKDDVVPALSGKTTRKMSKPKPTHPSTSEMVITAIKVLNSRYGSSLPAIKKFIAENYVVNINILTPFIKKFLKNSLKNGILVRTSGKGVAGSFKLSKLLGRRAEIPPSNKRKAIEVGTSQQGIKKENKEKLKTSKKMIFVGEVVVKNEPVKEEFVKQELDLMDEEDEEGILVKEEDLTDECEEVTVMKE